MFVMTMVFGISLTTVAVADRTWGAGVTDRAPIDARSRRWRALAARGGDPTDDLDFAFGHPRWPVLLLTLRLAIGALSGIGHTRGVGATLAAMGFDSLLSAVRSLRR